MLGNEKSAIGDKGNFTNITLIRMQFAKMSGRGVKQVVNIKILE
jgi:hypothetical protein